MGCSQSSKKSNGQEESKKGGGQAVGAIETGSIEPQGPRGSPELQGSVDREGSLTSEHQVSTRVGIIGLGDSDAKYNGQRGVVTKDLGGERYEVCLEETKETVTLSGESLVIVAKDSGVGVGAFVMLCQLHKNSSWNGMLGYVEDEELSADRVDVRSILDAKLLRVKPANLVAVEAGCNRFADHGGEFHPGAKVLLHSLLKMPELNGVAARVSSYDRESQTYHVSMENGSIHQVNGKYLKRDDRSKEVVEQRLAPVVPASPNWQPGSEAGESDILDLRSKPNLHAKA